MRPTEINPADYDKQLAQKVDSVEQSFKAFSMPNIEVFTSAALNYRMRAEFRMWHDGDNLDHVMFDQATKQKYSVKQFPPASVIINKVMAKLVPLLKNNEVLRRKLFQIDYLSTLTDEVLVSLVYHKPLEEEWLREATLLRKVLREEFKIDLIGRAKKQKVLLDKDYVLEALPVNERIYTFKQIENSFTQPNAGVNSKMLEWALDVTQDCEGDLLELYCGAGNFSLPLAQNFKKVLATEISKSSVAAAQHNIRLNNIENVTILRMSSEEFVQALNNERSFRRLEGVNLQDYNCQTVLVDPPRSGLDDETLAMVQGYANIVYISCNPETLKDNLVELQKTHNIARFALFDQFPYTHHVESGVFLQKR
ncbi:tRNA/tmRNA (uracil-C(5))-methyltransferase [Paraglaciecola mesophila]|uniref:tRNA/tmRNA (uracil-C(5))-methyltransferase n=1 Tax=Paraglaciecola mesophila TaxID=197222 RepID=A0A857JJ87_9ALTE|nr:tRNA (uridine(54)-C5)-methyltransferase TrmA [Paraglaciecola mesophila]QHJ12109.1 tRNA/tmRNA (uracil-C(5))-methyltransferase [Paraglaciecola mesophila]